MFRLFLTEEDGQTTVEYLLIIAVMVLIISAFGGVAKEKITVLTGAIFDNITKKATGIIDKAN